jgi:hypothetical protein
MKKQLFALSALAMGIALMPAAPVGAQDPDSTRRVTSTMRIPVRKDQGTNLTRQPTREEVMLLADRARMDSLARAAEADRARLEALEASLATATTRAEELGRSVTGLQDSLRMVRGELTTVNTRAAALQDSVARLDATIDRWTDRFNNGSVFGKSGFYLGIGSGTNITTGTLDEIGYEEGLNVVIPIGFHKRGSALGFRAELGVETFDGVSFGGFSNTDPRAYSAVGMLTLHLPFNQAKTNSFYLMGGGGAYMFRDIDAGSTLSPRLGSATGTTGSRSETKFAVTGGVGLEFHILGATSFFVQSRVTNLFADAPAGGTDDTKNLRWIPLTAGFMLR